MKKKVITTTVATGLLAAGVLTSNNVAKADTVPTGDNTKTNEIATQESNAKEIAQSNVNKAQTNLDLAKEATKTTSDNLQAAKTTEEIATKALDSQNQQVKNTQDKVNSAQQQVSEAQANVNKAEDNAAQATDENIQTAKDNISNQEKVVADAQSKENQVNNAVATQNAEVSKAQTDVNKAQDGVTDAQNKVNEAQANVDKTKQDLSSTNVQEAIDNAKKAEAQVNQDKQDVATAQTNLDNAKKADATRQANIDNAQKAVNQAQANVDFTAKQAQEMKDQLAGFQDLQNRAQKTVDDLNDKLNNVNTIVLPKGYTKEAYRAWDEAISKKYSGTATQEDLQAIKNWEDITSQKVNNEYKHNKVDEDNKILNGDIHNLTQSQLEELATFTASLLNPLRKQIGSIPLEVSKGSIEIAQAVAKKYEQDNWTAWGNVKDATRKGHDTKGLVEVAGKYDFQDIGENLGGNALMFGSDNMDQLKEYTYVILVDMLLDDANSSWGHARAALGLLNNADSYGGDNEQVDHAYIGVSFDNIPGALMGAQEHFNFMYTPSGYILNEDNTARISNNEKFDTTPVEIPSTDNLIAQLNTAKSNLSIANDKLAQAQQADKDAQAILAKHENVLKVANANLNKAKSVATQTPQAQQALTNEQDKLANDIKANEDAQAKKAAALGDQAAKQQLLNKANEALTTAQNNLNTAKASLSNANNKLNTEKTTLANLQKQADAQGKAVKDAQDKLNELKNKLSDLQNATQVLIDAQNKFTEAKTALATLQDQLNTEKAKLPELQNSLSKAQADVVAAQKDYDTKVAAQKLAQSDLDDAKKVLQAIYDREALEAQIAAQEKAREEAEKKAAEEKANAQKNGYHVDGNKVIDENGNQVLNWTVKNGQIIDNNGKVVSGLTINKAGAVVNKDGQQINSTNAVDNLQAKRTQSPIVQAKVSGKTYVSTVVTPEKAKANALPQTGEKESKTTLVGAILVGLGSLIGLFGLGRKKEY